MVIPEAHLCSAARRSNDSTSLGCGSVLRRPCRPPAAALLALTGLAGDPCTLGCPGGLGEACSTAAVGLPALLGLLLLKLSVLFSAERKARWKTSTSPSSPPSLEEQCSRAAELDHPPRSATSSPPRSSGCGCRGCVRWCTWRSMSSRPTPAAMHIQQRLSRMFHGICTGMPHHNAWSPSHLQGCPTPPAAAAAHV